MTDSFYNEKYRPQYHFTARQNWLNDPNGLVYYQGIYHLFFQHNPSGIEWGNMTWGHAISRDLVHWQQLENVLPPDSMGTMFSGSAVVDWDNTAGFQEGDEKTIVLIYTAAGNQSPESKGQPFTQCIACSTDGGRSFTKYTQNPVLKHIVHENRDPKVTWHAPLVAPGQRSLLDFNNRQPALSKGMHFNLYNNIWGTNFPMWYDDDARFRFTISFER